MATIQDLGIFRDTRGNLRGAEVISWPVTKTDTGELLFSPESTGGECMAQMAVDGSSVIGQVWG